MASDASPSEESDLLKQVERLKRQQEALVLLARRSWAPAEEDPRAAFREITEASARTLHVERVSVWLLSEDRRDLLCHDLFELSNGAHSEGVVLTATQYPRYFAALDSGRAIDAHDAREDPRTSEFKDGYLVPLGITSMMDAAVRREGRIVGVVCHEHVGPRRRFTADEVSFAGAIADQAAIALETAERRRAEQDRDRLLGEERRARALAEGAVRDREELLSIVSHELRGPLTSLGLAMDGALDCARSVPSAGPAEGTGLIPFLEMAQRQTSRLSRLLHSLLDLALVQAGLDTLDLKPMDLCALVADVVAYVTARAGASAPSVALVAPREVHGRWDPVRLELVVQNLVSNAIKYGEGKPITVSVEDDGSVALLSVADQGIGIAPEDHDRIFRCYERAHSAASRDSLGLGLYIAQRVARAHGGSIAVDSRRGHGARFTVTLPLEPAS